MQASNFKYPRRSGTNSILGQEYEFKILALLSLRYIQTDRDLWFLFNSEQVGDLDDVIVRYGDKTFMLQLKHQDEPTVITQGEFLKLKPKHKEFYLQKYIHSIQELEGVLTELNSSNGDFRVHLGNFNEIRFVLYTNRFVNVDDATCNFLVEHSKNQLGEELSFLNTNTAGEIFRFDCDKLKEKLNLDKLDYNTIGNFYLFTNQIHVNDIDKEVRQAIEKLTKIRNPVDVSESYIKYITEWCKGNIGGGYCLTKQDIISKLVELVFCQYDALVEEPFGFHECKKRLLWNDFVRDKIVTLIDHCGDDKVLIRRFLSECIGSEIKDYCEITEKKNWDTNIPKTNKSLFYQKNEDFKFQLMKIHSDCNKISLKNIYRCLWYLKKLPMVLQVDQKDQLKYILNVLKLSNYSHKVIIINTTTDAHVNIKDHLENLNDLSRQHQDVILEQEVELQGRPGAKLSNLIDKAMFNKIKTVDIINILLGRYKVGEVLNRVPQFYINRRLSRIFIKSEALKSIKRETLIIDDFGNCMDDLDDNAIIINNKQGAISIDEVCSSSEQPVHHLNFQDGCFEWLRSSKSVKNLKKYVIDDFKYSISESNINASANLINLVSAAPGMGKTMLMDHIAQEAPVDKWILRIDLNAEQHRDYYEDYKCETEDTESIEHFKYFKKPSDINLHDKIFQKFLKNKNVIVILDGFDEISILYKEQVRNLAKSFINDGFSTWITTRPVMKAYLEEELATLALNVLPFTQETQKEFLMKYLDVGNNEENSKILLEEFVDELIESFKRNVIDKDGQFSSTPLHIRLLGEYFMDDCKKYVMTGGGSVEFSENFDLLDLYDRFIKSKIKILCDKFGLGSKEWRITYKDCQSVCALKLLFPQHKRTIEEYLKDLNIDDTSRNIQFLQKEGVLMVDENLNVGFTHRTFAEYLAAEWLSVNFKNRSSNVKNIVRILIMQRFTANPDEFAQEYTFLFGIFDRLLSRHLDLHVRIINGNVGPIEINLEKDKIGRSIIHMMALYIRHHPNLVDVFSSIAENLDGDDSIVESDMLGYTALDYALMNNSLTMASLICGIWKNCIITIGIDLRLQKTYLTRAMYPNYVHLFDTILAYFIYRNLLLGNIKPEEPIHSYISRLLPSDISCKFENLKPTDLPKFELYEQKNQLCYATIFSTKSTIEKIIKIYKNINFRDADGKSPLHYAILHDKPEIIDLLLSHRAEVNQSKLTTACPLYYVPHPIFHTGISIPQDDYEGNTPLHYAVSHRNLNAVNLLLKNKANITMRNSMGETVLHQAAQSGDAEILERLLSTPKSDINVPNAANNTPLHVAILRRNPKIASILLAKHADFNISNSTGCTPLHLCALTAQSEILAELLASTHNRPNLNARNKMGETPLHVALLKRDVQTISLLLANNPDVNIQNKNGDTPLHLAASFGDPNLIEKLLNSSINIENINAQDKAGYTVLHLACKKGNLETAKKLILHKADINLANSINLETPLLSCLEYGHDDIANLLIEHKSSINVPNGHNTPLHLALLQNKAKIVNLLLTNGADVNVRNSNGSAPLHYGARYYSNPEVLRELISSQIGLNVQNNQGNTPLHLACRQGNLETARWLLQNGADANVRNLNYFTSSAYYLQEESEHCGIIERLMHSKPHPGASVIVARNTPLHDALLHGRSKMVDMLLDHNADSNAENSEKSTPLHYAVSYCNAEIVGKLIAHKADLNLLNDPEGTPLHRAILYGKLDVIEILLESGSNVNAVNLRGKTPFHCSVCKLPVLVIEKLIKLKADIHATDNNGRTALHDSVSHFLSKPEISRVNLLLVNGCKVNAKDNYGDTPLHIAACGMDAKIVELLLSYGADMNGVNKIWNTPLLEALIRGRLEMVMVFLSNGADVGVVNFDGDTPLHYGATYCSIDIVEKLIFRKTEPNVPNKKGCTALHCAALNGKLDVMKCLLSNGADLNIKNEDGKIPFDYLSKSCKKKLNDLIGI